MRCKCKVCGNYYSYNRDQGYAEDVCGPFCDGRLQGRVDGLKRAYEQLACMAQEFERLAAIPGNEPIRSGRMHFAGWAKAIRVLGEGKW